ncbi:MAG: DUF1573 domain-containing protein [Chitinophagales bacterium]
MKTFFELIVIAATLFIFTACSQTSANENQNKLGNETELVQEITLPVEKAALLETGNIPKTMMSFASMTHDFGTIEEGDKVSHVFTFTNSGDEPLIISDVKSSCGCTSKEWPKEPVAPGAESQITVEFNSKGKPGKQTKSITVNANTDPNPIRLTIKANVNKAPNS